MSSESVIIPSASPIQTNTAHVKQDALATLSVLLELESRPLYACGRSYLENLLMWRDQFGYESPTKKARGFFVDDNHHVPSSPLSPVKKTRSGSNCHHNTTTAPSVRKGDKKVSPKTHPQTLWRWRARVVEWMFELADSLAMDRNIAVTAANYLDTYSMYCLFPVEFTRYNSPNYQPEKNHFAYEDYHLEDGITKDVYLLASVTCFFIASKMHQTPDVCLSIGQAAAQCGFTAGEVTEMELAVLNTLKFSLNPATPNKFIREMLPLLLDDECSRCHTGFKDEDGVDLVMLRNDFPLGTFQATTWLPQTVDEVAIGKQAFYFADIVMHTSDYPEVSTALPSKIALAAVLEAVADNIVDCEEQANIQDRLEDLCQMSKVFDRDDEVQSIRETMRTLLQSNVDLEKVRKLGGESPVAVCEIDPESSSPAGKQEYTTVKDEGINVVSQSQNSESFSPGASVNSIAFEVNPTKDPKKEPDIDVITAANSTIEEVEDPGQGRVWCSVEEPHPLDLSKRRSCDISLDIFDVKPKAAQRVSEVVL
jgi:hypothetical protein